MLKAHYRAADRKLTSKQLSEAAGFFKDLGVANMQYGSLGRKSSRLAALHPLGKYNDDPLWITVLTNAVMRKILKPIRAYIAWRSGNSTRASWNLLRVIYE